MRGVVILGDGKVAVKEFPNPKPGRGEVLVRTKAAAICGSDIHVYHLPAKHFEGLMLATLKEHSRQPSQFYDNLRLNERNTVKMPQGALPCSPCSVTANAIARPLGPCIRFYLAANVMNGETVVEPSSRVNGSLHSG